MLKYKNVCILYFTDYGVLVVLGSYQSNLIHKDQWQFYCSVVEYCFQKE